jgi:hypothetical protein
MEGLPARQTFEVFEEAPDVLLDRFVLSVGRDDVLRLPHNVSIGFNSGVRFGSHNSVNPSAARSEAFAV